MEAKFLARRSAAREIIKKSLFERVLAAENRMQNAVCVDEPGKPPWAEIPSEFLASQFDTWRFLSG